MRAVIEQQSGEIETVEGVQGRFDDFIDEHLRDHDAPRAIWCVMDELGEDWDAGEEPAWKEGQTRRFRLFGPNGSGVVELPWCGVDFWILMSDLYPRTCELMTDCAGMEATEDGPVLDDDEAAALYRASGYLVKVSDCRREDEWEGTDVWDEGEFPTIEEAVERARREAATKPTDPAKPFRHVWIEDGDGEAVWDSREDRA